MATETLQLIQFRTCPHNFDETTLNCKTITNWFWT